MVGEMENVEKAYFFPQESRLTSRELRNLKTARPIECQFGPAHAMCAGIPCRGYRLRPRT